VRTEPVLEQRRERGRLTALEQQRQVPEQRRQVPEQRRQVPEQRRQVPEQQRQVRERRQVPARPARR